MYKRQALDEQKRNIVELEFTGKGAEKFANATEELAGQNMGIYMDEEMISNPLVNGLSLIHIWDLLPGGNGGIW